MLISELSRGRSRVQMSRVETFQHNIRESQVVRRSGDTLHAEGARSRSRGYIQHRADFRNRETCEGTGFRGSAAASHLFLDSDSDGGLWRFLDIGRGKWIYVSLELCYCYYRDIKVTFPSFRGEYGILHFCMRAIVSSLVRVQRVVF